jgi:peptidoglycan hydrolase-like protein with peptidoglycan-binding domain
MIKKILTVTVLTLAIFISTSGSKAEAASTYTENITVGSSMTVGSTGNNVVVLQGLLSELGYLNMPFGVAQGYFGNITKDAVARYQTAQNVSPTAGYFGPATKVAMHQEFAMHNWLMLLGW